MSITSSSDQVSHVCVNSATSEFTDCTIPYKNSLLNNKGCNGTLVANPSTISLPSEYNIQPSQLSSHHPSLFASEGDTFHALMSSTNLLDEYNSQDAVIGFSPLISNAYLNIDTFQHPSIW